MKTLFVYFLCGAICIVPTSGARAEESGKSSDGNERLPLIDRRIYDPPVRSRPINLTPPEDRSLLGKHVRLNDGQTWRYGVLTSANEDRLVLRQKTPGGNGALLAVPRSSIQDLQVRIDHKHDGHTGTLVGAIVGLIGGAAIGLAVAENGSDSEPQSFLDSDWSFSAPVEPFVGALLGLAVGSVAGSLIGSSTVTHSWQNADLSRTSAGAPPSSIRDR